MRATVINNIILDNTTALAMQKEYKKLWECKELQQVIKGTIFVAINKVSSFNFVQKSEIISALYIYFCRQVDAYTPIYNRGLIPFRAYIIAKLQVLQRYPSALGYNIVNYGKKYKEIQSSCVKLACEQENDIDSIANILTNTDGQEQEDEYKLEDNKKIIIQLVQQNNFFTAIEKEIIVNYVTYDIESQIDYYNMFGRKPAANFCAIRERLAKDPTAIDDLLDYLCDYNYTKKQQLVNRIVSGKKLRKSVKKPMRKVCVYKNNCKKIYRSLLLATKELNIDYNLANKCIKGKITNVNGYTFAYLN